MPMMTELVVYVEGENDVNFLMNINQGIPELKSIIDLEAEKISIIPLVGGNLSKWIEKDYLKHSNIKGFLICDSDRRAGAGNTHQADIDRLREKGNGSDGVMTSKREMENYVNKDLLKSFPLFKNVDFSSIKDWETADIPTFITNQIRKECDFKTVEKKVKRIINGSLSKQITKKDLEDLNAYDEIEGWFKQIRNLYDKK